MSRPYSTDERGQAAVELVIAVAVLMPLLLAAYQVTRIIYARLELVSLTREAAMYMIHEGKPDISDGELRQFAGHTRLAPDDVKAEVVAASLGNQLGSGGQSSGLEAIVKKFLLGRCLRVTYTLRFSGVWQKLRPNGLAMTETVVFHSGTWKSLGWSDIKGLLF